MENRKYRGVFKNQDATGNPFCYELPRKPTLLLVLEWLFRYALQFELEVNVSPYNFQYVSQQAYKNKLFQKMIGEADTVFFWFAEFPWIATRSVTVFVECLVRLSKAHGLSEYWKAMFVQLGFGLANTTGRILFFVGLQSLPEKFKLLCKFSTEMGILQRSRAKHYKQQLAANKLDDH